MSVLGVTDVSRESVRTLAEIFSDRFDRQCRAVALCGPPDPGATRQSRTLQEPLASMALCRSAHGCLVGAECHSGRAVCSVVHSIRLFHSAGGRSCISRSFRESLAHRCICWRGPAAGGMGSRYLSALTLWRSRRLCSPMSVDPLGRRITAAARRARGLPGRFEILVWGERDMQQSLDGSEPSRVAETTPQYGQRPRRFQRNARTGWWSGRRRESWHSSGRDFRRRRRWHARGVMRRAIVRSDRSVRRSYIVTTGSTQRRRIWRSPARSFDEVVRATPRWSSSKRVTPRSTSAGKTR